MSGQAPEYLFISVYYKRQRIWTYNQEFSTLNIPLFKTVRGQKTFYYKSVSIWNKIDTSLKLYMKESGFLQKSFKKITSF